MSELTNLAWIFQISLRNGLGKSSDKGSGKRFGMGFGERLREGFGEDLGKVQGIAQ